MTKQQIHSEYFDWMYKIVCGDEDYNKLSYRKLLMFLYNTEFTYCVEFDDNRAQDGIDFRYRFGYANRYSYDIITNYLDEYPCSVLEMMVAISYRVEEQIMDDYDYGNRTGQWFWNMLANLGLEKMSDNKFDESYAIRVISRFLSRKYEPDGRGGLFIVKNTNYDLRDVDIWTQCMWYLNEITYQ